MSYETMIKSLISEPDLVYHSRRGECLTSSSMKDYKKNPSLYKRKSEGEGGNLDTEALYIGSITHVVVLEGSKRFMEDYSLAAPVNKQGKEYGFASKAFKDERTKVFEESGKLLARLEDYSLAQDMRKEVHCHELGGNLLRIGVAEKVVRIFYNPFTGKMTTKDDPQGMSVQIKMDLFTPNGIIDLKTVADIERFHNNSDYCDIHKYGYLHSAAFYRRILHASDPYQPKQDFYFVVVEKTAPHPVGVWKIDPDCLDDYEEKNDKIMQNLKTSLTKNVWENPYETLRTIDI